MTDGTADGDSHDASVIAQRAPGSSFGPVRLRRREDFQRTLRRGRRARHPLVHLVSRRTDTDETRVGFSVPKRVGNAVTRNRVRRRLREIVRTLRWRCARDVVLLVQPPSAAATYHELEVAVGQLADRLALLDSDAEMRDA